ncbi:MAG TPA: beta-ketoacyl-ACP synthase III [Myxococcales bacterium]|nr:beta-ketoacyl-ACP synthase III [Myxococcales bacterium]
MLRTHILGTGFVVGEHLVKNDSLAKVMDTTNDWIKERSGIEQRYYVEKGTATSDLGAQAARKALADAKVAPGEVDYIVFATMTPDYYFPGCGSLVQAKLGLPMVPALDIRQQCSGFVYGLQVSDALLRSGQAKTLLLVGAEVHSGFMPWDDAQFDLLFDKPGGKAPTAAQREWNTRFRDRTVLFGDAGAAVVLRASEGEGGVLGFKLHADGAPFDQLYVPSCGFANRPYTSDVDFKEGRHIPVMNGKGVFKMAVLRLPEVIREVCAEHHVTVQDIDMLILHQANLRISELVQRSLELPDAKVYNNIQKYGNTTAATIPIAYDECRRAGRVKKGDLVCFASMGAGFHWAAALMRE